MGNELDQYDFDLPRDRIAQEPVRQRSDARMMILDRQLETIEHSYVRDLPTILQAGDCLVMNDTKVIPARLVGHRTGTGGRWEGLFLRANDQGIAELLCKTRGTMQVGETITIRDNEGRDAKRLVLVAPSTDGKMFFQPEPLEAWDQVLERCGRVPLPPYIRDGQMTDADRGRYQTVYAQKPGSVAAPTAGLHFTPELLQHLRSAGIAYTTVTLHVGIGTFRPIQAERLEDHRMHSEYGEISDSSARRIQATRSEGGRIIAVGTTSVRLLESAVAAEPMDARGRPMSFHVWRGETDLFIRPGFSFHVVDGMLTNFHLPKSSLLVMVCALAGRKFVLRAYQEAIRESYRFYSYGDCMLIL